MPVERTVVDRELGVECLHDAVGGNDQGIDLGQHRVALDKAAIELPDDVRELLLLVRILDTCPVHQPARDPGLIALERVDVETHERVGVVRGDVLDLDTALGGEHEERLLRAPVERDRKVVLLRDVGGLLDPELLDDMAADVETDDLHRLLLGVGGILRELDPARLPPAARQHLGLDDDLRPELLGRHARLGGRQHKPSFGNRNAEPLEELLALILEKVHRSANLAAPLTSLPVEAIVVQALRKRYGEVQALDGVSFSVSEGEVFGLLGPNGAGKSTTVRVLVTLTHADEGIATVAGHDVRREPNAVRRSIGYVPQDSGVDQYGTGRENLMLQGHVQGMSGRDLSLRAAELLQLVGISEAADRVVKTYSGGMRRRLDIALGLVHRPRVLFLDEPTTGLDPEARAGMWNEVSRLAEAESLTILLTTHYLEEADQLADRLAIVSQGKIVVEGTPAELKANLRGDAVQVELANGQLAEAQRLIAATGAEPEAVLGDRTVVVRVPDGGAALPGILGALDSAGIGVATVAVSRPSLDDVYLSFTGRDFNSEDRGE